MNKTLNTDVIKGLECCAKEPGNLFDDEIACRDCPYALKHCRQLVKDALDLIKRQQEEIETYQADHRRLVKAYKQCAYERDVLLEEAECSADRNCESCKHRNLDILFGQCYVCRNYDKWEPKETTTCRKSHAHAPVVEKPSSAGLTRQRGASGAVSPAT